MAGLRYMSGMYSTPGLFGSPPQEAIDSTTALSAPRARPELCVRLLMVCSVLAFVDLEHRARAHHGGDRLGAVAVVVAGAYFDDELVVRGARVRVAGRHAGQGLVADQVGDRHAVRGAEHREFEDHRDEGRDVLVEVEARFAADVHRPVPDHEVGDA